MTAYEIVRRWRAHVVSDAVAHKRRQDEREAERRARIMAARRLLLMDGTLRRVANVRRAIRSDAFHDRFMARDRSVARDLQDLCRIAVEVLVDMGVDMADVQLMAGPSASVGATGQPAQGERPRR